MAPVNQCINEIQQNKNEKNLCLRSALRPDASASHKVSLWVLNAAEKGMLRRIEDGRLIKQKRPLGPGISGMLAGSGAF